jgi:hypothetical protein
VLPWPLGADQPPPPGRQLEIGEEEPSEARLQFLENLAREDRLVLLYAEGRREAAELVARRVLDRLEKK